MAQDQTAVPTPVEGNKGAPILGPRNPSREAENPDLIAPPPIDSGSLPNLRFLELFRAPRFEDVSLAQWMALVPPELVQAHLNLDSQFVAGLRKMKQPVV